MVDRRSHRSLLNRQLGKGRPHKHITTHIDQNPLSRTLVEHPELSIACHSILEEECLLASFHNDSAGYATYR